MRSTGLLLFVSALALCAQTAEDPEVARARIELGRVQAMVETGALPRAQLQKAQDALADAGDAATIRRSIYDKDLTEEQADRLVAAADRRFERRKQAFDDAKTLVDAGAIPAQKLDALMQDMDFARQECELAATRADLVRQIRAMADAEAAAELHPPAIPSPAGAPKPTERFDGDGVFTPQIFENVEAAFERRFGKPLPVSANGETAVHRALGFDHRGRVDVALHPDQPEGVWLREYLKTRDIPYFAFRKAEPGKATGAHIHMGPVSTRLPVTEAGG